MTNMINNIGELMTTKARMVNEFMEKWSNGEETGRPANNPHYSEFMGMKQMVKAMGIEYEANVDVDAMKITSIVIMGKVFEV